MKVKKIVFFYLIIFNIFYSEDIYVTGINIRKEQDGIILEWKAETNCYDFIIFRSFEKPIDNLEKLKKSEVIFSNKLTGEEKDNYFLFKYKDSLIQNQNIYYLVLPVKNINKEDFLPNINFNYKPYFIKRDIIKIKDLFGKRYRDSIIILWDVEGGIEEKINFKIYKTNQPFDKVNIDFMKPYAENIEDFFFEDFNVRYGEEYYYLILPEKENIYTKENVVYLKGEFFPTNGIFVEKELKVREKIKKSEFIKNFTNQGK
ncbi:MAG: hypothetical protein N2258_07515 [Brevinematales bacterium]|nr:hypothetical protein [Brevinematales bacterium]